MELHFVGKNNLVVTPALKDFTTQKLQALETRFNHISHVNVVFHIEHITQTAEATVHLNGTDIHASAESEDMYKSVEMVVEKLLHQITKRKEKIIESHR